MAQLIIFVKNPQLGKVKTRLASTVGDEKALQIYLALLDHTRSLAESIVAERWLFYSQWIAENDGWSSDHFNKNLQHSGGLGERMAHAFEQALAGGTGPALIIGSDCAQLTSAIVEEAIAALDQYDFVVGPAEDGGYYLLGMREFRPEVFQNIAWSTAEVFPKTIEIITKNGWTYQQLVTLSDIDYEEDWATHGWDL